MRGPGVGTRCPLKFSLVEDVEMMLGGEDDGVERFEVLIVASS